MAALAPKSQKKKHIKHVPQKVKLFRASEPLLSVLMWGINSTSNELSHVNIPVMLLPDDFKAYSKMKVDNHMYNKENLPSHFKVKEYCPLVFRNLRERFNVTDLEYQNSFVSSAPTYDDSSGKSGSKFLRTHDGKFFVKTITREEVELMFNVLPEYHKSIVESHGETLLPQYLGMYRLTVDGTETYMVVLRSIFSSTLPVHTKYDLKGSTIDRQASEKEKDKELPTYKDNDFLSENKKIHIGTEAKDRVLGKLKRDVEFLSELKLMDYSLLVGIHDRDRFETEQKADHNEENGEEDDSGSGGALTPPDSPGPIGRQQLLSSGEYEFDSGQDVYAIPCEEGAPKNEVYFLGLIDILTHWGAKKKAAQAAKTVKHGAGAEISTVRPEQYAKRFLDFIEKVLQ
ncbi:phosphatidylinositol 5-phosphate 4-kinase type-2 beta-like [Patiria miniata]|uniref:1-phosphatidylinositol-5-phosphate 4-kinase n=1 Tax=Patiria miniata TaxID=46514 RepID=A0A913YZ40_PATMI|nr:phosphatidylinositol 5-phosphate 4-kinase type-2 beta-like [Patiria miniata]